jgi:hypothetical protein
MPDLGADKIVLQQLTAVGTGSPNGNWFDLSGYRNGAFWVVVTSIAAGSLTLSFHMSPDASNDAGAIPAGELAVPTAISAAGVTRYPFIGNMAQAFVRAQSAIVTGPVTATVYFIGKT